MTAVAVARRKITMPNWVENSLEIKSNDVSVIKNITEKIKSSSNADNNYLRIASTLYPIPEELSLVFGTGDNLRYAIDKDTGKKIHISIDEFFDGQKEESESSYTMVDITEEEKQRLVELYGACDWYKWNVLNYGTKWGDCETTLLIETVDKIVFVFNSPWNHSALLGQRISSDFKVNVELSHYSIENWEKGHYHFDSGELKESHFEVLGNPEDVFVPVDEEE
jgi:hypothetical protein